jgi:hypothetical protein
VEAKVRAKVFEQAMPEQDNKDEAKSKVSKTGEITE